MRIRLLYILLGVLLCILILRIFCLQVIGQGKFRQLSNKNCIRILPQPGARGSILDRNGEVLVDNYLTYDVLVSSQDKTELENDFVLIAKVLETTPEAVKKKFRANYLAPFLPVRVARNVDLHKIVILEEMKLDLPGIIIQPNPTRRYPYGSLASHLIGYLQEIDLWRLRKLSEYGYQAKDIVGYAGIEERYDYYLRQIDGAISIEVDNRGRFRRTLGYKPPEKGKDLRLSIDLRMQKIAEEALSGRKGAVVMLSPQSGEVYVLASSPSYNPDSFINKNQNGALASLFADSDSPMVNRAIAASYPAASVFKLVVASGVLDQKKINLNTSFDCPGYLKVGKRKFNCWDRHGVEDLYGAIAHSCDVFFYHCGLFLGGQLIHDYALKFGFSKPTGIDLPNEVGGFVPSPLWRKVTRNQVWYDGDTANFSIGQGDLLVTPIQIARMAAVFANQGYLVTPYLLKGVDGQDISAYQKKLVKVGISDKILKSVREGMRRTVSQVGATANILASLPVAVAGKTGTAQVTNGQPHAWFCGFFPYKDPQYAICVFLENGGGGFSACMVTRKIIEDMAAQELL